MLTGVCDESVLLAKMASRWEFVMFHYLITMDLCPVPGHMHAYLMCKDKKLVENTIDRMMDKAKELGFNISFPIILVTELSTKRSFVRKFVKDSDELKKAKECYLGVWMMHTSHPDDKKLMAIH